MTSTLRDHASRLPRLLDVAAALAAVLSSDPQEWCYASPWSDVDEHADDYLCEVAMRATIEAAPHLSLAIDSSWIEIITSKVLAAMVAAGVRFEHLCSFELVHRVTLAIGEVRERTDGAPVSRVELVCERGHAWSHEYPIDSAAGRSASWCARCGEQGRPVNPPAKKTGRAVITRVRVGFSQADGSLVRRELWRLTVDGGWHGHYEEAADAQLVARELGCESVRTDGREPPLGRMLLGVELACESVSGTWGAQVGALALRLLPLTDGEPHRWIAYVLCKTHQSIEIARGVGGTPEVAIALCEQDARLRARALAQLGVDGTLEEYVADSDGPSEVHP